MQKPRTIGPKVFRIVFFYFWWLLSKLWRTDGATYRRRFCTKWRVSLEIDFLGVSVACASCDVTWPRHLPGPWLASWLGVEVVWSVSRDVGEHVRVPRGKILKERTFKVLVEKVERVKTLVSCCKRCRHLDVGYSVCGHHWSFVRRLLCLVTNIDDVRNADYSVCGHR